MTYNEAGELIRIAQPMGPGQTMVRTFSYDENGNQLTATDARGTTEMFYDAGNRMVSKDLPNGFILTSSYDGMDRHIASRFTGNGWRDEIICFCNTSFEGSSDFSGE